MTSEVRRDDCFSDGMREGYGERYVLASDYDALLAEDAANQATMLKAATTIDSLKRISTEAISQRDKFRAALILFLSQCNACGPNSDFGRYFQNVRDAALSALAERSETS